jgi:hypothetical protein
MRGGSSPGLTSPSGPGGLGPGPLAVPDPAPAPISSGAAQGAAVRVAGGAGLGVAANERDVRRRGGPLSTAAPATAAGRGRGWGARAGASLTRRVRRRRSAQSRQPPDSESSQLHPSPGARHVDSQLHPRPGARHGFGPMAALASRVCDPQATAARAVLRHARKVPHEGTRPARVLLRCSARPSRALDPCHGGRGACRSKGARIAPAGPGRRRRRPRACRPCRLKIRRRSSQQARRSPARARRRPAQPDGSCAVSVRRPRAGRSRAATRIERGGAGPGRGVGAKRTGTVHRRTPRAAPRPPRSPLSV